MCKRSMLAEKLNMKAEEAECWIVNLIRNARLDAKIDSKLGHVVMGTQPTSPYQQLIEKMDSLSVRSEALQALIERKINKGKSQNVSSFIYEYHIICAYTISMIFLVHFRYIGARTTFERNSPLTMLKICAISSNCEN